jgi:dolichyl-phosphate-mannose--protein O-mannosyl transferase
MISIVVVKMWDILHFKAIKELLHSSHFCQILSHLIIVAVVFFLHLFCYQLEISPDKESLNAEIHG